MADLDGLLFLKRIVAGQECLVPGDLHAEEWLHPVKIGKGVLLSGRKPRNPRHHSWFFALLRKVVENSDHWKNEEYLLEHLKICVGHVDVDYNPFTGKTVERPKSISFAAMDEDKFKEFRDRCLDALNIHLGFDPLELMKEVDATQTPRGQHA